MQTVNKTWNIFKGAVSFNSPVPATLDAYNEAANDANAALEDAISQHGMHVFLGKARSALVAAVEKLAESQTELVRNDTDKKDVKGKAAKENEDTYIQRLLASGAITKADLNALASDALAEVTFIKTLGSSGTTRAALGQSWLEEADRYIAAWEAKVNPDSGAPASAELTLSKMRQIWPGADLSDPTNREEVARLLRDFDKKRREAGTL